MFLVLLQPSGQPVPQNPACELSLLLVVSQFEINWSIGYSVAETPGSAEEAATV